MMADGTLEMLKFFKLEGLFFFSVSTDEIEMMVNASFSMQPFVTVVVSGTLKLSRDGILGALQFGASLKIGPTLEIFGASQFEINTYATAQPIRRYKLDEATRTVSNELEIIMLESGTFRAFVNGYMSLGPTGSAFIVRGRFSR